MDGLSLKVARIMRGWTQWDLATKVGVHPARISEMERGRREVTEAVVEALGPMELAATADTHGRGQGE